MPSVHALSGSPSYPRQCLSPTGAHYHNSHNCFVHPERAAPLVRPASKQSSVRHTRLVRTDFLGITRNAHYVVIRQAVNSTILARFAHGDAIAITVVLALDVLTLAYVITLLAFSAVIITAALFVCAFKVEAQITTTIGCRCALHRIGIVVCKWASAPPQFQCVQCTTAADCGGNFVPQL